MILSIILLLTFKTNAQKITSQEKINKAAIIFEGIVIRSKSYKDSVGNIWTSNIIYITQILKGKEIINSDSVEIILRGGNNYDVGLLERPLHLDWFSGGTGVFLCREINSKNNIPVLELAFAKSSWFQYHNDDKTRDMNFKPLIVEGPSRFYSLEEFYSFLKEQPTVTFQSTAIHPLIQKYFNAEKKK